MLSPSKGQVAYALLTRSPLKIEPKLNFPFDLHVLGTPPAFVLSQDQTLAFNPFESQKLLLPSSKLILELTVFFLTATRENRSSRSS